MVPGSTERFSAVADPRINNQGDVIFAGNTSNGWGLYRLAANDTKPTALVQASTTLKDGAVLDQFYEKYGTAALADTGDVAMVLHLATSAAIYLMRGSDQTAVARDGMDVPGLGTIDFVRAPPAAAPLMESKKRIRYSVGWPLSGPHPLSPSPKSWGRGNSDQGRHATGFIS